MAMQSSTANAYEKVTQYVKSAKISNCKLPPATLRNSKDIER